MKLINITSRGDGNHNIYNINTWKPTDANEYQDNFCILLVGFLLRVIKIIILHFRVVE